VLFSEITLLVKFNFSGINFDNLLLKIIHPALFSVILSVDLIDLRFYDFRLFSNFIGVSVCFGYCIIGGKNASFVVIF